MHHHLRHYYTVTFLGLVTLYTFAELLLGKLLTDFSMVLNFPEPQPEGI